jgi:hypothetical protein
LWLVGAQPGVQDVDRGGDHVGEHCADVDVEVQVAKGQAHGAGFDEPLRVATNPGDIVPVVPCAITTKGDRPAIGQLKPSTTAA